MPSFKLTLAYDGTDYAGWQRQANGVSIQGSLEEALARLEGARGHGVPAPGRTDAGVHAPGRSHRSRCQRAMTPDAVSRALNARLPDDIRVSVGGRARRLPRAIRRACQDLSLPHRQRPVGPAVRRGDTPGTSRRRSTSTPWRGRRALRGRPARLRGVPGDGQRATRTTERDGSIRVGRSDCRLKHATWTAEASSGPWSASDARAGDGFLRHMVRASSARRVEVGEAVAGHARRG